MGVTVNDHTLGTSPRLGGSRQSKSWNIGAGAIESFNITSINKILKASSIVSGKDAEILFRSRPETHIDTTCYQISLDLTTSFQPPSATQPSYLSVRVHTLELREQ
jgi:hypothetical protein